MAKSDEAGYLIKGGTGMKAFVKCPYCKHVMFTEDVLPLISLLLSEERYSCVECKGTLDFVTLSLCSRTLGDTCDTCEYRFPCFSMRNAT